MQGRLSHKFILHQRRFYLDQEKQDMDTLALDWGVLLLTSLFEIADRIWTRRCHKLHGEDVFVDPEKTKGDGPAQSAICQTKQSKQQGFLSVCKAIGGVTTNGSKDDHSLVSPGGKIITQTKIINANELLATHRPIYEYFVQKDLPI